MSEITKIFLSFSDGWGRYYSTICADWKKEISKKRWECL
jgi:hypothetical protein